LTTVMIVIHNPGWVAYLDDWTLAWAIVLTELL
jgi:hypothetical protein